jgi:hypothetical protein
VTTGPIPVLFNVEGAVWTLDPQSGDPLPAALVDVVYEGPGCTGTAWVPYLQSSATHTPLDAAGMSLMVPFDTAPSADVAYDSHTSDLSGGACSESGGVAFFAVPLAEMVDAGSPPPRTWAPGPLHRVPGPP